MSRWKNENPSRDRRSPTQTVADVSNAAMAELNIPDLPKNLPDRLVAALRARAEAFLYELEQATRNRYIAPLEIRLVRDAHRAVLTTCELGLSEGEVYYARFRKIVKELGYERSAVGFDKPDRWSE